MGEKFIILTNAEECPYRELLYHENGCCAYSICEKLANDGRLELCEYKAIPDYCPIAKTNKEESA